MIDITILREQPDLVRKTLRDRNLDPELVDEFLVVDGKWRKTTAELDAARAELKRISKDRDIEKGKLAKTHVKKFEADIADFEKRRNELILKFPNIPLPEVPVGKNEAENVVLRTWGDPRNDAVVDYLTLAETYDLIDVGRAAKVSGSRFGYLKNEAALLELALVNFVFDLAVKEGFIPIIPPVLVKPEMMVGMGKIKFIEGDDAFFLEKDNLYLVGSAEHSIGPMHANEVFEEGVLPRRYVAFSTSFRREAGTYGKDTRGILRVHQFDKVELFAFTRKEDSAQEYERLTAFQENVMQALELPYRVLQMCTGDMGFGDARQVDIEAWLPSEGKYRETHSASNTTDYQARGLGIKYRLGEGKTEFAHTLNATGAAIGRMVIMLLENHQTSTGTVKIPKALQKYVGMKEISRRF
ncbi:MAG: serine--tRNA ligase [Patescibacteria group bacterium]|mgnify:CR=1 FL=1